MSLRILIADDNSLMRRALSRTLQSTGEWEIIEAENGEDAVAKAAETKPHLIILDLAMPVMDGLRAARSICLTMPQVPIILHTLHWTPRVEVEAFKSGVRKVVPKSDSAAIAAAIREFLPIIQAESQASGISASEAKRTKEKVDPSRLSKPDENGPANR